MNRKLLVILLILLITAVIIFMVADLYLSKPAELNLNEPAQGKIKNKENVNNSYREIHDIDTKMKYPGGIAVDSKDNIIVAGEKLNIYDKDFKEIASFRLPDTAWCVVCGSDEKIYVAFVNHIEVMNSKGEVIKKWTTADKESIFSGIAAGEADVFVADAGKRIVHHYNLEGKFINDIGHGEESKGIPKIIIRSYFFDVALGRDNEVWITNPGKYLLEAFDFKGGFISSWGKYSDSLDGFSGCCNPTNFALLKDGTFVTGEKADPRVKIYGPDGKFKTIVAGPDKFDEGTKGIDIAIDSKERIYALDPMRDQVRIFEKNNK